MAYWRCTERERTTDVRGALSGFNEVQAGLRGLGKPVQNVPLPARVAAAGALRGYGLALPVAHQRQGGRLG